MKAELIIPPAFDRTALTPQLCHGFLQEAGVEMTSAVEEAVDRFIQNVPPVGQQACEVVALGTAALHGTDGYIEWYVEEPGDDETDPSGITDRKSHYERTTFITVKKDQELGCIHQPQTGIDGRDVTGRTLAAKDAKSLKFTTDDTILTLGGSKLVAQCDGVLYREQDKTYISQVLNADAIDFSTGNIDFNGDVNVLHGVKDCFKIRASGNVNVHGLIEAADIECGGTLTAHGGWAGRDQGHGRSGGDLAGRYLDGVIADVRGDLRIDKEVINSNIVVHGGIDSPHGAIIGGNIVCTAKADIGTLGSGGCVRTDIVLDTVPRLDCYMPELDKLVAKYTEKRDTLVEEQDHITKLSTKGRMTATDKERQCEIMFELSAISEHLTKAETIREALKAQIDKRRTLHLTVQRKLYPGVALIIRDQTFVVKSEVRGAFCIEGEGRKEIVYRRNDGSGGLLTQIADVEI